MKGLKPLCGVLALELTQIADKRFLESLGLFIVSSRE